MKTIVIFFVVVVLELVIFNALQDVVIIRHCDKVNDDDPCCSDTGSDRANTWHKVMDPIASGSKLNIYTSSANFDALCKPNIIYSSDSSCQHSQRMVLTSYMIYYNLAATGKVDSSYCIGDYKQLVKDINSDADKISHGLIVWKHTEIPTIINQWNVPLASWPADADGHYDIIFRLNFTSNSDKNPKLSYNCFDFQKNVFACSSEVTQWLKDYDLFTVPLPTSTH
jgi:hypothetical protein